MTRRSPRAYPLALAVSSIEAALLVAFCTPAMASNDLNLVGFGVQSLGMGGADIPVAKGTEAININPAGLMQIGKAQFDYYIVPYHVGSTGHGDDLNGKVSPDNQYGGFFGTGYAYRVSPKLVLGAGLYVQGGTGYQYKHLDTIFGTRDEYSSIFGVTKLATGLALQLTDTISVGANVGTAYSQAREKVFPNTSTAGFSGLRFDGGEGVSFNGRVGMQYKPTPNVTVGLTYATKTRLKLDDGTLTVNYEAQGLGRVRYGKSSVHGLALARDAGAGIAWRFRPKWLFATEVSWLDWSDALKTSTLRASHPNNPDAPSSVLLRSPLGHRDQYVFSAGLAVDFTEDTTGLIGINLERNAIPDQNLTPGFNLTETTELDLGFIHHLSQKWDFGADMQYQFPHAVRYQNPNQPFGSGTTEHYNVIGLTFELSRRW